MYERALSAIYLEQHDRVAQIEHISHTGLISKLYGGEPFRYPNEDLAKTYEKLDLDMIFWTLQSYSPCERAKEKGRSFSIRTDSWSELFPTTCRFYGAFSVSSVEDVLNYEPEEEVDLSRDRFDEVVDYFSREHKKAQDLFKAQLAPGGYYCTTFMWPVMTFGLEWTQSSRSRPERV